MISENRIFARFLRVYRGSREVGNPEVAQIEVFPRGNSILSNSVIPKVAPNGFLVEGFAV